MKYYLPLAISLLTALACVPAGSAPEGTQAPLDERPKAGGVFQFGAQSLPTNLDYYRGGTFADSVTLTPIFEPLIGTQKQWEGPAKLKDYRIDNVAEPKLAESWMVSGEGTVYTFKIREGVRWQDGVPFTAGHVAWAYRTLGNPANNYVNRSYVNDVVSVEATDARTLKLTLKGPSATVLYRLSNNFASIMPEHVAEAGRDLSKPENVVGTGPFKLKSYDGRSQAVYVKNDDYWQKGKPYLDGMRTYYGLDRSTRVAAFMSGKTDGFNFLDRKEFEPAKATRPEIGSDKFISVYGNALYFNSSKPPFNDIRARRAVNLAIDRQGLLESLTFGDGVINPPGMTGAKTGWIPTPENLQSWPGYAKDKKKEIAEAKDLIAQLGLSGRKLSVPYYAPYTTSPRIAEAVAAQLHAVGLDASVQPYDPGIYTRTLLDGGYDVILALTTSMEPDASWFNYFHTRGAYHKSGAGDSELDALLEAQSRELTQEKRKELFLRIGRQISEKVYSADTIEYGQIAAWQPWVRNYAYNIGATEYIIEGAGENIWIDPETGPKDRSLN